MKKNKNNSSNVEVSELTLKAIQGLLFDKDGVDMTAIIDDLAVGQNRDLVALNVGLVYKGLVPEVDKVRYRTYNIAYEGLDNILYYRQDLVSVSLILDKVSYRETPIRAMRQDDGTFDEWIEGEAGGICTTSTNDWLYQREVSEEDARNACMKTKRD